jgi:hypothetical protein
MSQDIGDRLGGHSCSKQADSSRVTEYMGPTLSERPYSRRFKTLEYGSLYAVPFIQSSKRSPYSKE